MKIAREQRVDLAMPAHGTDGEPPEGWATVRLADVVQEVPNVKPEDEPEREFGYVDISSVCNETHRIFDHKRFKGKDAPSRARRPIRAGDVLFSNVRTYLRNVAIVPSALEVQLCSTGFTLLRSNGAIDPQYLFRYVLTDDFIDRVTPQQTGTHYPATSDRVVMGESLPLPPLAEQQRIVAKVEALLARATAARQRLTKVPAILKRFRQSVLAAACSGRLTADWRESDPAEDYEIPRGWTWTTVGDLFHVDSGDAFKKKDYSADGLRLLQIANVSFGFTLWNQKNFLPQHFAGFRSRLLLKSRDIVLALNRPILADCLKVAIISEGDLPAILYQRVGRLRPITDILPKYAFLYFLSPRMFDEVEQRLQGTDQPYLNTSLVPAIPFPLAPLEEQREIVRRVEALFRLAEAIEKRVAEAMARAEKLTQAILAKAFRGELVPTEAELARREGRNYEPASRLLERVRLECRNGKKPKARLRKIN